jgi:hypothetical protein
MNRQIALISCLILTSGLTLVVPVIGNIVHYWIIQGLTGLTLAGIDIAVISWMIEMWTHESNFFLQCLFFCYSLGSVTSPLISIPFVSNQVTDPPHAHLKNGSHMGETQLIHETDSLLEVPYTITAITGFASALIMTYLFFSYKNQYIERSRIKQEIRMRQAADLAARNAKHRHTIAVSFVSSAGNVSSAVLNNQDRKARAISVANYRLSVIPTMISGIKKSSSSGTLPTLATVNPERLLKTHGETLNNNNNAVNNNNSYLDPKHNTLPVLDTRRKSSAYSNQSIITTPPPTVTDEDRIKAWYKYFIVFTSSCMIFSITVIETNLSIFLVDYCMSSPMELPRSTVSFMVSFTSAMIVSSRGIAVMMSTKCTSKLMILVSVILLGAGIILISVMGQTNELSLWISIGLMSFGVAPLFPSVCSFAGERISIGHGSAACLLFAARLCIVMLVYFMSPVIHTNPASFEVVNMIAFITCCICFITMIVSDCCCFPKFLVDHEEEDADHGIEDGEKKEHKQGNLFHQTNTLSDPKFIQSRYSRDVTFTRL